MADSLRMALSELVRKAELDGDADFLQEGVRVLSQALMELEVSEHLGAERYERTQERKGQRNGYRERTWDTRVGSVELRVPLVRDGCCFGWADREILVGIGNAPCVVGAGPEADRFTIAAHEVLAVLKLADKAVFASDAFVQRTQVDG